jgi:hypothetical protein
MLNETKENVKRFLILYPGIDAGWDLDDPKKVKEFHWFLSSPLGWNCGPNLYEEIEIRKSEDSGSYVSESANLFLVPGKWDKTHYKIDNAQPVVDGVVFITKIEWSKKK